MKTRPRVTIVAKWFCALLCFSILACWAFAAKLQVDLAETHSLQIAERNLRIFMWPSPRSSGDPDYLTLSLGVPAALLALLTLLLWWIDGRVVRRNWSRGDQSV